MSRRSRNARFANHLVICSSGLLLVAVVFLVAALLRGRSVSKDGGDGSDPKAAQIPSTNASRPVAAQTVPPPPVEAPVHQPPGSVSEEKPISLRSEELRQQYASDEVGADQRYKNKVVEVTGTVTAVYQESPLLGIGFGPLQGSLPAVLCEMDRRQTDLLSRLRRGQILSVRGLCLGKTQEGFIGIGNCRVTSGGR